jgi:hypothetical protein
MAQRLREFAGVARRMPAWASWSIVAVVIAAFILWLVVFAPGHFVQTPAEAESQKIDAAKRLELQNDVRTTLLQGLASIFHEESDKVIKRHPTPLLTCDDACASLHQCNHQKVRALTTIVAGQQASRYRS